MKKYYLLVIALAALMSCSSDEFVGDQTVREANENAAISFGFDVPQVTRAAGSDAATALSNQFVVYGEKSETEDGVAAATGNLVFKNYLVKWTDNSAYTTTSNTKNWEYVGISATSAENTNITPNSGTDAQTIKYWDYSATKYVFTAVSADPTDISSGRVKITKTQSVTSPSTVYDKGYTIALAKTSGSPDVYPQYDKIYFSDRQVITSTSAGTNREAVNAYGGNVMLSFRNMLSQVRAGIYETINGYDVTSITFYVSDGDDADTKLDKNTDNTFGAICPNTTLVNYEGNIIVTYYNDGAIENQPKVEIDGGTPSNDLVLGDNFNLSTTKLLGKISSSPTWDKSDAGYTAVLPQVTNDKKLILTVDYTLWNSVSGETIEVKGATAEIPAEYLKWKPNYKYTYLFKISDNTNGQTGGSITGLYPITFDAVTVVNETGQAEYITTVSEPSITTFGAIYNSTKYTSYVTGGNEYTATGLAAGSQLDIFATFMEGDNVKTPVHDGNSGAQHVKVYTVTTSDATNFPITEASVAESIANGPSSITNSVWTYSNGTYTSVGNASDLRTGTTYYKSDGTKNPGETGYVQTVAVLDTDYNIGSEVTCTEYTTNVSVVASVPGEDGADITINALKLSAVAAGTYAIEYEASAAWTGTYTKVYKVIKVQ